MKKTYYKPYMGIFSGLSTFLLSGSPTLPVENKAQEGVSADIKESTEWDIWNCETNENKNDW